MKHLLIIALLLSSIQGNAQVSGPPDSNLHIISGGKVIFPPGTIIYPPSSGLGSISHRSGYMDSTTPATHNYKMVYRDTTVNDLSSEYYPGRMINSFNYSHSTNGHKVDTIFIYDHYQWLLQRVREEQEYWDAICKKNSPERFDGLDAKIRSLNVSVPAARNRAYYSAMEDLLMDILYRHGETDWTLKSRDKSKRRTK